MARRYDNYPDDHPYERDEGVLVGHRAGHDVGYDDAREGSAPDDFIEEPLKEEHVPGTVDDLPFDWGLAIAPAADQELLSIDRGPMGGFGDLGSTEDFGS